MIRKLITDSSSDLNSTSGIELSAVPLKIMTAEREYIDNEDLDSTKMLEELKRYKGKSHSSCPNPDDYLTAFEGADEVFCVTITSGLSGSFNSANTAAKAFEEKGGKALVIDSLSAGPECALIAEKLRQLMDDGKSFDQIKNEIGAYTKTTHLSFALQSLTNLARNGRVNPLVAKLCGVLGIRVVGVASEKGTLEMTGKARGEKNALDHIFSDMKNRGYKGGRVRIHHAGNERAARALEALILNEFSQASVTIRHTCGLCSFYAEEGGLLVGYEG